MVFGENILPDDYLLLKKNNKNLSIQTINMNNNLQK